MTMMVELRRSRAKAPESRPAPRRVALVSAPFGGVDTPSLALGLLAESLRREGHHVDVHHLDLEVVRAFGLETYRWVAEDAGWKLLVGEWLAADPTLTPGTSSLPAYQELLREQGDVAWRERLSSIDLANLRRILDDEVRRWLSSIAWGTYTVVGFTVMFQQLNASLRLARAIKNRHPGVRVVLGGINLENPMGRAVAARFPWLDAVFSGYADKTFPAYVATLPRGPGLVIAPGKERIVLDDLPVPTYDEYLVKLRALGLTRRVRPQLPLETSRGCWWGQKHHCVFCGLNGGQMDYLDKSSKRVVDEVRSLQRYGFKLFIVDNILSARVYDDLLPRMRREGATLSLRWSASLKANLTREQLAQLAAAGIDIINPGIESLSTDVLRLMDKGETSIQNLWLLRACREMALVPDWHLLRGLPGEDPRAYRDQAELIPEIAHLPAPYACAPVTLVRFSPMHEQPERFGMRNVRPHRAYAYAFGDDPTLPDFAYVFEYEPSGIDPDVYTRPTRDAVRAWKSLGTLRRPRCEVVRWRGHRLVLDTRKEGAVGRGRPRLYRLSRDAWHLLECLDRPTLPTTLEREWAGALESLRGELADLERRRLVIHRDGRWMRLVVFPTDPSLLRRAFRHVVNVVRRAL